LPPSGGAASVPPRIRRRWWAGTWRGWGSLGGARADPARADGGLRDDHPKVGSRSRCATTGTASTRRTVLT